MPGLFLRLFRDSKALRPLELVVIPLLVGQSLFCELCRSLLNSVESPRRFVRSRE